MLMLQFDMEPLIRLFKNDMHYATMVFVFELYFAIGIFNSELHPAIIIFNASFGMRSDVFITVLIAQRSFPLADL